MLIPSSITVARAPEYICRLMSAYNTKLSYECLQNFSLEINNFLKRKDSETLQCSNRKEISTTFNKSKRRAKEANVIGYPRELIKTNYSRKRKKQIQLVI